MQSPSRSKSAQTYLFKGDKQSAEPYTRADLAKTLSNLGMLLTDAGRFDEAETALRESIAIRRELFGDNS